MKKQILKFGKLKNLKFSKSKVAALNSALINGGLRVDDGGGKTTDFPECKATDVTCHWTQTTCDYRCGR
ncbi:hypothetical protein ACJD0Z_07365 [Flavobacteriaceae bacterium M23B6Z8]